MKITPFVIAWIVSAIFITFMIGLSLGQQHERWTGEFGLQASIDRGHVQYNPTTGEPEWKESK